MSNLTQFGQHLAEWVGKLIRIKRVTNSFFRSFFAVAACLTLTVALAKPGDLDTTFGSGGIVIGSHGGLSMFGPAVKIQPDGKIVAAGYSKNGSTFNLSMARFSGDSFANPGFSLLVPQGWNLLGNGINQTVPVASLYGNSNWVNKP